MTNYYVELYLLFIGIYLIHAGFISKRYAEKLVPCLFNQKIDWDPNNDRFRLMLTSVFFLSPLIIMKSFISLNSSNSTFNHIGFIFIITLTFFCFFIDIRRVNSFKIYKSESITVKKGRKNISLYKYIALVFLLEEKFYKHKSEMRKHQSKIDFCKHITSQTNEIKDPKTLANNITELEKENLDTIFKRKEYQKYIPLLLENGLIKSKKQIVDFLQSFKK